MRLQNGVELMLVKTDLVLLPTLMPKIVIHSLPSDLILQK